MRERISTLSAASYVSAPTLDLDIVFAEAVGSARGLSGAPPSAHDAALRDVGRFGQTASSAAAPPRPQRSGGFAKR